MAGTPYMEDKAILPVVDEERCSGCGECVTRCPAGAVTLASGRVIFTASDRCTYCGVCEDVCPEGAVSLYYEVVLVPRPPAAEPRTR